MINEKKCRVTPSPNAASPVFNTDYIMHIKKHITKTKIKPKSKIRNKYASVLHLR